MPTAIFAPELYVHDVKAAIDFYTNAFGALEVLRWSNDDGSVHVAEMLLGGSTFHMHEPAGNGLSPLDTKGISVQIGLFLDDPDALFQKAADAGATIVMPLQDFEYGYRQGILKDPFGHYWQLQKRI
jgi:PhnB protein